MPHAQWRPNLKVKCTGINYTSLPGVSLFDPPDPEEFFAAAFQVGFHFLDISRRYADDHSDSHIKGLQKLVGIHFANFGKVLENRRNRPGIQIERGLHPARQNTREGFPESLPR